VIAVNFQVLPVRSPPLPAAALLPALAAGALGLEPLLEQAATTAAMPTATKSIVSLRMRPP
jgi:hypothetical protein